MVTIWEDPRLRQTGRTTRMLRAAVVASLFNRVVIVCADKAHVSALRTKFAELAKRFAFEAGVPEGFPVGSSLIEGWADGMLSSDQLTFRGGEPIFENDQQLQDYLITSTSFVFVGEPTGYGRWPGSPVVFVDHHVQRLLVEGFLERSMGF